MAEEAGHVGKMVHGVLRDIVPGRCNSQINVDPTQVQEQMGHHIHSVCVIRDTSIRDKLGD